MLRHLLAMSKRLTSHALRLKSKACSHLIPGERKGFTKEERLKLSPAEVTKIQN